MRRQIVSTMYNNHDNLLVVTPNELVGLVVITPEQPTTILVWFVSSTKISSYRSARVFPPLTQLGRSTKDKCTLLDVNWIHRKHLVQGWTAFLDFPGTRILLPPCKQPLNLWLQPDRPTNWHYSFLVISFSWYVVNLFYFLAKCLNCTSPRM